jgi:ornithine cyclodeaminase/alanine dehydrogenase-like protein (mu-crystallin family)
MSPHENTVNLLISNIEDEASHSIGSRLPCGSRHGDRNRMSGLACVFDGITGHPQAVLEAGYLTDLRTGAGTGLAARHLARPSSSVVTTIGAGRKVLSEKSATFRDHAFSVRP